MVSGRKKLQRKVLIVEIVFYGRPVRMWRHSIPSSRSSFRFIGVTSFFVVLRSGNVSRKVCFRNRKVEFTVVGVAADRHIRLEIGGDLTGNPLLV